VRAGGSTNQQPTQKAPKNKNKSDVGTYVHFFDARWSPKGAFCLLLNPPYIPRNTQKAKTRLKPKQIEADMA
jgi:hypothetical protein